MHLQAYLIPLHPLHISIQKDVPLVNVRQPFDDRLDFFLFAFKFIEFSVYLVSKGFKILEVGSEESFTDGNITRAEYDAEKMILRACQKGKPTYRDGTVIVEDKYYNIEMWQK